MTQAAPAPFRFRVSTNLRFGVGESEKLGEELKDLGFARAAAVVDGGIAGHPQVAKALASVRASGVGLEVFRNDAVEPDYDALESFRGQVKGKTYDCLIGIGGGSTLDLAKGVAVLLTNEGEAISFRGFPKLKNRPLPVVALPTTAGTGSEVTYNAVFTDSRQQKKLGINSILNFPVCAIIDPLLTAGSPRSVSVSSGADAMVHTLESFVHRAHTPVSRTLSKEAFRLLFNNLGRLIDRPDDLAVRGDLALGAYLAAMALMNAGSGPSGALSYPLGVHYKVPHGLAGAVFLPGVTEFNIAAGYTDYAQLYDLIEGADASLPAARKPAAFADALRALWDKLGVPRSLSAFKLGPKDIDFMAGQYEMLKGAIAQNPVDMTREDVGALLKALA